MKTLLKVVTWCTGLLTGLGISMGVVKVGEWILGKIFDEDGVFAEEHPALSIGICVLYIAVSILVPFWLVTDVVFKVCTKICEKIDKKFDKHIEINDEETEDMEWQN